MKGLSVQEITIMFLALGVLLSAARIFGEIARKFNQPSVLGEMLAGIILGPTILGSVFPEAAAFLFPTSGNNAIVLEGLTTLAVALFLLVAGMEVDLSTVWRQGKAAVNVGVAGIIVPFAIGMGFAWTMPMLLGMEEGADKLVFSLFFATALSIAALPVIAKTLMDLNLYRSDMGMLIIAAAIFQDLVGWIIFAVILGMMGASSGHGPGTGATIGLTLGYVAVMLTLGRWLIHKSLPWIQAYMSWPGGILGFALVLAVFGAAFTEWIGVHAIFGAFIVGVAIGDSSHLREQTRTIIHDFISFIFAPLFFVSIGLKVNFIANFDLLLSLTVIVIATIGKVAGNWVGAKLSGMSQKESLAVGFALNARGAMEIILGILALQYGVISERMFVALVIMALGTSVMAGPLMQRILQLRRARRFSDHLSSKSFILRLDAQDRVEAISELAVAASAALTEVHPDRIAEAVRLREDVISTGLDGGIAVPHARIYGLPAPIVALGLSPRGVDFNAPDASLARIIVMILTPPDQSEAQLEILSDVARTFARPSIREQVLKVTSYTELLAVLRAGEGTPASKDE